MMYSYWDFLYAQLNLWELILMVAVDLFCISLVVCMKKGIFYLDDDEEEDYE